MMVMIKLQLLASRNQTSSFPAPAPITPFPSNGELPGAELALPVGPVSRFRGYTPPWATAGRVMRGAGPLLTGGSLTVPP